MIKKSLIYNRFRNLQQQLLPLKCQWQYYTELTLSLNNKLFVFEKMLCLFLLNTAKKSNFFLLCVSLTNAISTHVNHLLCRLIGIVSTGTVQ